MNFETLFEQATGNPPFPWQVQLYHEFLDEDRELPLSCNLPTGLGKTSIVAVWLLAMANKPRAIPRRLVYVVNRRTVVDQTTTEVQRLRKRLHDAGLDGSLRRLCAFALDDETPALAISTLRGEFADNREWSADPARPAVIVGTVDMIGSRLLFSGYGIGFRGRPLHAGFLSQDVLLVHDEAHLEPAFQKLIENIENEQRERERVCNLAWPKLRVMALSATTRGCDSGKRSCQPFTLTEQDYGHPVVQQRIEAKKSLHLNEIEDEKDLADRIAELALHHKLSDATVLVFARTVVDVERVSQKLADDGVPDSQIQRLTGTMRGYERDGLVRDSVFIRFLPSSDRPTDVNLAEGTVYLVCTSAGEVGVNLSADHMVCDLSTFDSMAQRLGRVNRFGDRDDTQVDVVHPAPDKFEDKDKLAPARKTTLELLKKLKGNASPLALSKLDPTERQAAFSPEPIIPQATDILFDAWALTTIRKPMPGRPPVAPYLHGIAEWEPPRTSVAWREDLDVINDDLIQRHGDDFPKTLLDDYPLKPHELLSDNSERVLKALDAIEKRAGNSTLWIIDEQGQIVRDQIAALLALEKKQILARIANCTVLLPPSVGGLTGGMLDGASQLANDVADQWYDDEQTQRRVRLWDDQDPPEGMALVRTIDTNPDADEFEPAEAEGDSVEEEGASAKRGRFWHWYVRPRDAEDATPASVRPVTWQHHTNDVVERAREIVDKLDLPEDVQQAVILAAELHDLGKKRELWQRSIGNPNPADLYAKPGKPMNGRRWRPWHITDYRHEFGSLLDVLDANQEYRTRLDALSFEMQDVVLHLITSHHGRARPHFVPEETVDPNYPQSVADEAAVEAMRRYARLQRRYGRWGLAYLESLLRAADWAASANPSDAKMQQETAQ